MPLPPDVKNERRQDCIDHELRIDKMGEEVHTFRSYFQLLGGSIGLVFICLGWFGSSINGKLESIETLLSADKVAIAELKKDVENIRSDIKDINDRHKFADQNGKVK